MSVVNCKVQYIRPKYLNLQEWMDDEQNVYIGRSNVVFIEGIRFPKHASPFANPYKIGKDGTREEVLEKYKKYIINKIKHDEKFKDSLLKLKGKTLGCWCNPEPCHGDILLKLIEILS